MATAQKSKPDSKPAAKRVGHVTQVIGSTFDAVFDEEALPEISEGESEAKPTLVTA